MTNIIHEFRKYILFDTFHTYYQTIASVNVCFSFQLSKLLKI